MKFPLNYQTNELWLANETLAKRASDTNKSILTEYLHEPFLMFASSNIFISPSMNRCKTMSLKHLMQQIYGRVFFLSF